MTTRINLHLKLDGASRKCEFRLKDLCHLVIADYTLAKL